MADLGLSTTIPFMMHRCAARPAGILAAGALLAVLAGAPERCRGSEFGRVTLKSDEVIRGSVLIETADAYILRTPDGIRLVPRASVSRVETAEEIPDAPPPAPGPPPAARAAPAAKDGKAAPPKAGAEKGGKAGAKQAPAGSDPGPVVRVSPDRRIEEARSGGPPPVVELAVGGTVDGKPLSSADPFTVARLASFFERESRPRFEVLPPEPFRGASGAKEAGSGRPAEYTARVTAETSMVDIKFFDTPVIKKVRTQLSFQLVRKSDKKSVVEVETVEDADGDPEARERSCRSGFEASVKSLLDRLRNLKPFGGAAGGTDLIRVDPSSPPLTPERKPHVNEPASSEPGGRGTFRGELGFGIAAVALAAAVGFEFVYYALWVIAFFAIGGLYRPRVRRIVLGGPAAALAAALFLAGCGGPKPMAVDEPMGDSESFQGQMQELRWSLRAVADQSDSKRSLEEDLDALRTDPQWRENIRFDVENLFFMPDARESLEWDLKTLGDPDYKTHGLGETFQLLGW